MGKASIYPKEKPVGTDQEGRPIFGYGPHGRPVCFAHRTGQPGLRCGSEHRFPNGRCKMHGGMSPKNPDSVHYKTKLFAQFLKGGALEQVLAAARDPDYLNMQAEIALNLQGITQILERNIDYETFKSCFAKAKELEEFLFSQPFEKTKNSLTSREKSDFPIVKMEKLAEEVSNLLLRGKDQIRYQEELDRALTRRAKLIELDTKRVQFESNHMSAEQVLALFSTVVDSVRKCFKNDIAGLIAFGQEVDKLSGLMQQGGNAALRGRPGVTGMLQPRSEFAEEIRNEIEAENAEFRELNDEEARKYNAELQKFADEDPNDPEDDTIYFLDPDLSADDMAHTKALEIIAPKEEISAMENIANNLNRGVFRIRRAKTSG